MQSFQVYLDKIVDNQFVLIGEVGLGGEVRSVGHIEKRIQEAEKLGFQKNYHSEK